jgi:hypothetical protein
MVQVKRLLAVGCWLLGSATLLLPGMAGGQSAYVPLDDVAYVYVDALVARGQLRALPLLERPYTTQAIRSALSADSRAGRGNAELRARLERALRKYEFSRRGRAPVRAELSASIWATGETSGQRELMVADDVVSKGFAGGAARFLMAAGPFVGFSRPILENRLNTDPDFAGRKDRSIAGRNEDGYVTGQWRFGEIFFGRTGRNWGPVPLQGLMLGSAPYSYDHLFGRLGTPRLNVSLLLARLDDDSVGTQRQTQRHFAAHRLSGRWRWLEIALAESFVYSGVGRGFEPTLANPLTIYALTWRNDQQQGNLQGSASLAARTRAGIFSGEFMLDDAQFDRCDVICEQPASYGLTFTAEGVPFVGGQRAFASYTRVAALTYRNKIPADRYTSSGVSLGRAFSDYDEFRVGVDIVVVGAPLRPYFARRRQGEGDYRLKEFPPVEEWPTQPGIFEGAVTTISRFAVSGGAVLGPFDVTGDVGYNSVGGATSALRPLESGPEGRVRLTWSPPWARLRIAP